MDYRPTMQDYGFTLPTPSVGRRVLPTSQRRYPLRGGEDATRALAIGGPIVFVGGVLLAFGLVYALEKVVP